MSFTVRVMHIFFFALLAGTASASPIQLTLTLEPAETLPGLPVSFRIQAVNTSASPARLPRWAVLQVTPRTGHPYLTVAGIPRNRQRAAELRDGGETLAAGETRQLDWWAGPESPPWWAGPFWLEPGVYSLRLIADDGLENYGSDQYNAQRMVDPIISNSAMLTIQQPTGADAEVWRMAKAKAIWNWKSLSANEIWTRYPESTYAGYTLPRSKDDFVTLAAIERLLSERSVQKKPHGAYLDWWRLQAIQIHRRELVGAVENDPNAAYQHAQIMCGYIDAILANDTDPVVKSIATREKLKLPTLAQLEEHSRQQRNIYAPLQKVSPVVECVVPAVDGSFTAHFGYDNPNLYDVKIPVGARNKFSPEPQDRGQAKAFVPGRWQRVFSVTHTGGDLVWTLDSQTVTASVKQSPRCPQQSGTATTEETPE